jgi:RNase H-fold protein (predicted Holliday junction resolvase)
LRDIDATIVFQDESLTSVMAEKRLESRGGLYSKGDIDSEAAAIILQDYMEQRL